MVRWCISSSEGPVLPPVPPVTTANGSSGRGPWSARMVVVGGAGGNEDGMGGGGSDRVGRRGEGGIRVSSWYTHQGKFSVIQHL